MRVQREHHAIRAYPRGADLPQVVLDISMREHEVMGRRALLDRRAEPVDDSPVVDEAPDGNAALRGPAHDRDQRLEGAGATTFTCVQRIAFTPGRPATSGRGQL